MNWGIIMRKNSKIRLLVVSQYFYPEIFRINDICKELVNLGYDLTVLTGIPNYPIGIWSGNRYGRCCPLFRSYI